MHELGREFWDGGISLTPAAQKRHSVASITIPYEGHSCDITLFVYCHNDADTLTDMLAVMMEAMEVAKKSFELVIIDDASTDHTVEFARGFMMEHPKLPIVLRVNKHFKGMAENYTDAAFIGTGKYFRMICCGQAEPVETLVDVMKAVGDADILVPYFLSIAKPWRERTYEAMLNLLGGYNITHFGGAPVHLRYNLLRWRANTRGPAFQIDILCRLIEQGFTLKQVPCRALAKRSKEEQGNYRFWSAFHVLVDVLFRRFAP